MLLVASCDTALPFDTSECTEVLDGRCWTFLGPDYYIRSLADTPWGVFAGPQVGYWETYPGVLQLDAGSGTWQARGLDHAVPASMLMVPGDTTRLLVGLRRSFGEQTEAAIFATEDGGDTWLPWDGGLAADHEGNRWANSLAMDPGNPSRLYWGMGHEILRSEDGGRNWELLQGDPDGVLGLGIEDIVVSPHRDGRIWAGGRTGFGRAAIYRSNDWGDTWEHLPSGKYDNGVIRLAADPDDPQRLWAGEIVGRVRVSEDGGSTWDTSLSVPGNVTGLVVAEQQLFAAAWEPAQENGGSRLRLWVSSLATTEWTQLATPTSAHGATRMIVADDGSLLISTGRGIWRVSK